MRQIEAFARDFFGSTSAMPPVEEKPKLEYNLAGGLALTVRERDFRSLCEGLVNSGYRYACVLPFRSLTKDPFGLHLPFLEGRGLEGLKGCPIKIIHLEPAWNPTYEENIVKALAAAYLHRKKYLEKKGSPLPQRFGMDFSPARWIVTNCLRDYTPLRV